MSLELARSHVDAQARIRERVGQGVGAAWSSLDAYNESDVDSFLRRAVPVVRAGESAALTTLGAYLARELGRRLEPVGASEVLAGIRGGVSPEEVYRRPFVAVWSALRDGVRWEDAVSLGLDRAVGAAATDVQLAMTHGMSAYSSADTGIYGFQRVPNAGACQLCLIASTQRYHSGQLMPIHSHCGCGVAPLTEPSGQIINRDRYERIKRGSDVKLKVRDHGELGPVLTNADHSFDLHA